MRQLVLVDDDIREFTSLPRFDLLLHRPKVPFHPIDTDRNAVDQGKRLRMLGEHRRQHCCNAKGNFQFERTVRYRQE